MTVRPALDAAQRLSAVSHRFGAYVPVWCCEAYLEAVQVGSDPVRAVGRAHFGAEYPLYDSDPAWLDEERRPRSRTFCSRQWTEALAKAEAAR